MSFETWAPEQLEPPIAGDFGRLMSSTRGAQQDEELELLRAALLSRLPARCPDDALDVLAKVFQIDLYPGETTAQRRARVVAAWPTHLRKGSAEGAEGQLEAFGVVDVRVYQNEEIGDVYDYSAFVVKLGPDFGDTGIGEQLWGDFTWGGDMTWGSTATPVQRNAICRIVRRWKATHGVPVKIVLDFGGAFIWGFSSWGDTSTWGEPSPCEWYLANVWGESMVWGESTWGTGRWFAPGMGF